MRQDPGFEVAGVEQLTFVASGGFSTVYRGFQPDFGRWVAVKVVHRVGDREAARRRFEREQLAMGRLSQHPHVVNLYGSGLLPNGEPYLLMDYLSNGSLAQQLTLPTTAPAWRLGPCGAWASPPTWRQCWRDVSSEIPSPGPTPAPCSSGC